MIKEGKVFFSFVLLSIHYVGFVKVFLSVFKDILVMYRIGHFGLYRVLVKFCINCGVYLFFAWEKNVFENKSFVWDFQKFTDFLRYNV